MLKDIINEQSRIISCRTAAKTGSPGLKMWFEIMCTSSLWEQLSFSSMAEGNGKMAPLEKENREKKREKQCLKRWHLKVLVRQRASIKDGACGYSIKIGKEGEKKWWHLPALARGWEEGIFLPLLLESIPAGPCPSDSHWSVLHSLAVLVDCKSHWSSKSDALGAHLSRVPPKSWGINLFLGKSSGFVSFLSIMGCCRRGRVCNEIGSQLFLPASMWFLSHLPDVKGLVTSPDFPVFRRNSSECRFDVSVGGILVQVHLMSLSWIRIYTDILIVLFSPNW